MKAIILSLLSFEIILGLTPTDICIRNKDLQVHFDKLNKYRTVQTPLNCLHTSNPYECGPNYCTLNKVVLFFFFSYFFSKPP